MKKYEHGIITTINETTGGFTIDSTGMKIQADSGIYVKFGTDGVITFSNDVGKPLIYTGDNPEYLRWPEEESCPGLLVVKDM